MNYTDLAPRDQATYGAQCRTLVQALTTIPVSVEFKKVETPAAMHYDRRNGETKMVISNAMPVDALAGLVIHECGHVLATTHKHFERIANKCEGKTQAYINIVEDYRIEYGVIAKYFPWAMQYIRQASDIVATLGEPVVDKPSNIVNLLFKQQMPPTDRCHPDHFGDALKYVEQWGPTILSAEETGDLEEAALALQALDKKHGQIQPPEQPSKAEKQRRKMVYGAASEELDERDKQAAEAAGHAAPKGKEKSDDEGDGEGDDDGDEENDQPTPYSAAGNGNFRLRPVDGADAGFQRALMRLSGMRNRLHDAIISSDLGAPQRYTKRGQLDCRRIAYASSTDTVFQQPFHAKRKANTAIDVVIDCSGSMSSGGQDGLCSAHIASATAFMLGTALSRIDGTHVGVLLYDDDYKRMHGIHPMRGLSQQVACKWASACGGTNTEKAVTKSTEDLLQNKSVNRRICLVITDSEEASQAQIDACDQMDVEVYCLCIASQGQNTDRVKHCSNVAHLPSMVTGIVQSMLASSRHQWVA